MRILITGTSGLLGSNLALETARSHTVFGVDRNDPLKTKAFTTLKADLLDPGAIERILDEARPDWVIHCAALADVDACERSPKAARELNTELPHRLAYHVSRGGARLLHVSTDAVFDGLRGNYTEADAPNPINVYAQTKLEGERAVLDADPRAIVGRVNLFGWSLTGRRSLAEFFFNNLSQDQPVNGFTDVFFCPVLVNDIANLFVGMLKKELSGLYHVVSSQSASKYEFGVTLAKTFGFNPELISPISVAESGLTAARSPNLVLDVSKLIHDLGEIPPTISTGLARLYALYQQGYPQALREMGQ